jgi:uncharacterized protein
MGGAVAGMLAGDCKEDTRAICLWVPAGNMKDIPLKGKLIQEIDDSYEKGFIDFNGFSLGVGFMKDVMTLDILEKSSSYDKQALFIHGNKDDVVPLSISQTICENLWKSRQASCN